MVHSVGEGPKPRWPMTKHYLLFVLAIMGAAIGGVISGGLIAGAKGLVDPRLVRGVALILILYSVAGAVRGRMGRRIVWLQRDRETPRALLGLPSPLWAMSNGMLLGTGWMTRIGLSSWYVMIALWLLAGRVVTVLISGMLYGAMRSIPAGLEFRLAGARRLAQIVQ